MGALPPILNGDISISDLIRGAAERSITIGYIPDVSQQVDTPLMSGMILAEEVQPGLLISGTDLTYTADYRLDVEMERSVSCAVLLSGWGEALQVADYPPIEHELGRVQIVGYGEPMSCTRPWRKGQRSRAFGMRLDPSFFDRFHETIGEEDLTALEGFMEPGLHSELLPWSGVIVDIAEAALNEPYGGALRTLYREAQALRFMFEVGSLLQTERRLVQQIGRRQYDRVCQAREVLDQSLVKPPKLLDLAKQLGVNVTTLQANFKAAFGTTVFGYVRSRRLDMGRVLIREHRLGIAEAAYRVGFNSASAFTAAYRRQFGRAPSEER